MQKVCNNCGDPPRYQSILKDLKTGDLHEFEIYWCNRCAEELFW